MASCVFRDSLMSNQSIWVSKFRFPGNSNAFLGYFFLGWGHLEIKRRSEKWSRVVAFHTCVAKWPGFENGKSFTETFRQNSFSRKLPIGLEPYSSLQNWPYTESKKKQEYHVLYNSNCKCEFFDLFFCNQKFIPLIFFFESFWLRSSGRNLKSTSSRNHTLCPRRSILEKNQNWWSNPRPVASEELWSTQ